MNGPFFYAFPDIQQPLVLKFKILPKNLMGQGIYPNPYGI